MWKAPVSRRLIFFFGSHPSIYGPSPSCFWPGKQWIKRTTELEGIECGENCQQPKLAYTLLENSLGKNSYWKKRKKKKAAQNILDLTDVMSNRWCENSMHHNCVFFINKTSGTAYYKDCQTLNNTSFPVAYNTNALFLQMS